MTSHCNFTPAELVAGVHSIQHRVDTGRWDAVWTADSLNATAASLGYGSPAPAFIHYYPGGGRR